MAAFFPLHLQKLWASHRSSCTPSTSSSQLCTEKTQTHRDISQLPASWAQRSRPAAARLTLAIAVAGTHLCKVNCKAGSA